MLLMVAPWKVVVDATRVRRILGLALPIMGGMLSQNVMNLADTAMVGRLGKESLAAVGIASFATYVSQSFLMGLGAGVQAVAARRHGERRSSETALPLNGGLVLALLLGVPISVFGAILAPYLFPLLNSDPGVVEVGVPYWQVRLLGVVAIGSNVAFRGYWNGVNLSRVYLRTLLQMHAVNLVLNYLLIFGKFGFPELGATGAAIGTTLATYVGTLTYFVLALKRARAAGFLRAVPDRGSLGSMFRLSLPNGVQQVFFSAGLLALFWVIGLVGTVELAAANLLVNVTLVGILPAIGLGLAAMSLVGQALGRGEPKDARRWGWEVAGVGLVLIALLALPMVTLTEPLLSIFVGGDDELLAATAGPLRVGAVVLLFDAVGLVLMNALLGAGDTRRVAYISVGMQWLVSLPAIYLVGPVLGYGLVEIWLFHGLSRLLQALVFAALWRSDSWRSLEV